MPDTPISPVLELKLGAKQTSRNWDAQSQTKWQNYLKSRQSEDCSQTVRQIIQEVRQKGDEALNHYNNKFDNCPTLQVSKAHINQAEARCSKEYLAALKLAFSRIEEFHRKTTPKGFEYTDANGNRLGQRWRPIGAAGLYVPGGTAAYPSSLLMNAVPAIIAGVKRIAVVVPTPKGEPNWQVLAALKLCGIAEAYTVGGAQAVAALAYGTKTIAKVDKITGPGNQWVTEAKRQVFGDVGIDTPAGPSEVLIIADEANEASLVATDLLAQAEHDPLARVVLITDSEILADKVKQAVATQLKTLPRRTIATTSWQNQGAIIVVDNLADDAPKLADELAAEHLQICTKNPEQMAACINYAGSIFIGSNTPEAIGDYVAGPNHILPTGQTARFASGLSVMDFMVRNTTIQCSKEGFDAIAPAAATLADAEQLTAHQLSITKRTDNG